MKAQSVGGWGPFSEKRKFSVFLTGVQLETKMLSEFILAQNCPNPFNPSTTIRYGLPHKSEVRLTVFNTLGQQVAQLVSGEQAAGFHEVKFDASSLSSGVYFSRIHASDFVLTRKPILLR